MQTQNRFLDDIAKLATGAAGVAAGMRGEVEAKIRLRLERLMANMELVTREEFDAVRDAAAKTRAEQEILQERVRELTAKLAEIERATGK